MGTLSGSLRLSQSACVRLVDRLEAGGLVRRQGRAGTRQTELVLTRAGRRSADRVVGETGDVIAGALEAAFPDPDDLSHFVAALDRLATVAATEAPDVYRICRVCDVSACLAGGLACPSADACRAAADAGT
jgi:DNA-binding MarR family transcriptional regulator